MAYIGNTGLIYSLIGFLFSFQKKKKKSQGMKIVKNFVHFYLFRGLFSVVHPHRNSQSPVFSM